MLVCPIPSYKGCHKGYSAETRGGGQGGKNLVDRIGYALANIHL